MVYASRKKQILIVDTHGVRIMATLISPKRSAIYKEQEKFSKIYQKYCANNKKLIIFGDFN